MKRLVFAGSVLGALAAFLAACLAVLATLIWLLRRWEPAPWVLWVVGLGMTGAAVAAIWRWWRLPSERRFRFTLRGMLIGIALFALWFGVVGTDVDQIAAVKAWFEEASKQRYPNCSGSPAYWRDGSGGACLSLRFEGRRRRMYEVGLGNGVYSTWRSHCSMSAADEQDLRTLLGVQMSDWNTDQAVH